MGRVKITWEEAQEKYPNIVQIFAGQFHEDAEGETEEILNREVFRIYTLERLQQAIKEMELLQESFPDDNDLGSAVGGQLGARWKDPAYFGYTYSTWLDFLKDLFRQEITRREKDGITQPPF
jgi:hypothetical protein